MKPAWLLLSAAGVLLSCSMVFAQEESAEATEASAATAGEVTIVEVKGTVEVRPDADTPWSPAEVDQKIGVDWTISTGPFASAKLRFADNSEVTVNRLTEVTISDFREDAATVTTRIDMQYGSMEVEVKKGTQANDFEVQSPTYSLSVKGTKVRGVSFYKGYGGMVQMGSEGTGRVHVNPTRTIVAGETTNDKLQSPIIYAKTRSWVPLNIPGYTKQEENSNMQEDNSGPGTYDKLRSGNPSNGPLWQPSHDPDKIVPSNGTEEPSNGHVEPW